MRNLSTLASLRTGVAFALIASTFIASGARAQAVDEAVEEPGEAIVVTGSLFRNANTETASPVTVLNTETLQRANITTISDAIRSVAADSTGSISTGFRNGFSAGGSAISLRGLGVSSTVILIDGLRSANFPLSDDGHNSYVDLNSIPFSIIDHVDVLKDGASSTYGADAVGGVVNIVTKRHFAGIEGSAQGGVTMRSDGASYRATLTAGYGDFDSQGFNIYVNGEYTKDRRITNHSRGYPFNTLDLTPSGLADRNRGDDSLTTASPQAVVARVRQTDLNNPLAGMVGTPLTGYQLLDPTSCPAGTFSITTGAVTSQGTGCRHNLPDEYNIIQPEQQRYSFTGRASVRLSDELEGFLTGSYSNSQVTITGIPQGIRQTQPYGSSPARASNSPGIVLPVYVCAAGTGCATAPDRRLNPNNPYAASFAGNPSEGAARIYYLFGDIPFGSDRTNESYRFTAGIVGTVGDGWDVSLQGVYARNNLKVTQHGYINVAGLLNAVGTGAYNFVNPSLNTQAVRDQVSPDVTTPSYSTLGAVDASVAKSVMPLAGGDLQVAIGGQVRRETLNNRSSNPLRSTYNLNTSSASGRRTVLAAFFEIDAPVLDTLTLNASGRYDHYSEGFDHFSPKLSAKFTPIPQISLRGTYSEGFRAPTFAENNPASSYAGFSPYTPPAAFVAAHGGSSNAYSTSYNIGSGSTGNPDLKPETSRAFTLGVVLEPTPWLSFTVDYYNIKKSNLIVSGPQTSEAIDAYYAAADSASGCAALAAVGQGYACNSIDGPDPLFPNALPRLLVLDTPFVNANYWLSTGLDYQLSARIPLGAARFISRLEVTHVLRQNLVTPEGVVQKYAGTLGPYELSSGGGTPRFRGNWQNTIEYGDYSVTATANYVSRIKSVAADEITPVNGVIDLSCANALAAATPDRCYIKSFISVDLNATARINNEFRFFVNVGNVFDARAPLAAAAYTSNPNYLVS
jgi:iron complex outermembrane receptor protein